MPDKFYIAPDMPIADHRQWIKEEVLSALDRGLSEKFRAALSDELLPDDRHAMLIQRNRVAKLLKLSHIEFSRKDCANG